ncbi:hypothetical protein [Gordonia sp. DT101]|uniref:hypothetical protein n=1 Tax=Gordonia sp. DT101 TaxID=3416545 RepID=UPI003CE75F9A
MAVGHLDFQAWSQRVVPAGHGTRVAPHRSLRAIRFEEIGDRVELLTGPRQGRVILVNPEQQIGDPT